ncbi:MAG: PEP-CTERM sorting domain-containing protein [Chthonomonas sp.]|nr:PEP-CTERM sorting domain-containing protein [Chthonomonas sp.]
MKKLIALAVLTSAVAASQAVVLYDSNGFEGFALGNLSGQNNFTTDLATPVFNVQNTFVQGTKAVQVNGGVAGSNWSYPTTTAFVPTPTQNIARISVDIARTVSGTTPSFAYAIDVYNTGSLNAFARTLRFGLTSSAGNVRAFVTSRFNTTTLQFDAASAVTNVLVTGALTQSTWYRFNVDMNYTTKRARILINNTDIAGGFVIPFADLLAADFSDADLHVSSNVNATDRGYFDNYKVEAVPEPGTIAALGLGAAAILRRRKASK